MSLPQLRQTMLFLAQSEPTGLTDVLLIPGICFFLGMALWYGGLHFESRTEKVWLKWCAIVPLAFGLIMGIPMALQATDYVYQQLMPNKKTLYSHYLAPALPLVGLIIVTSWHFYLKRTGAYDRF